MSLSILKRLFGMNSKQRVSHGFHGDHSNKSRLRESLQLPSKTASRNNILGPGIIMSLVAAIVFMPVAHVFAAAYITLNSFSGTATSITVSGGGWGSGESISLYLGSASGTPKATVTAGADSFFPDTVLDIPDNTPQGPLPVIAVGSSGQTETNSYYVVPFTPSITVTAPANTPGSTITISGEGFAPTEEVTLSLGGVSSSVAANSTGSFANAQFVIPNIASQTHLLHATGVSSGADAIDYFYVGGFYPGVTPSVYYLLPEQQLSFNGSGFRANELIDVTVGGSSTTLATITADATGSFSNAGTLNVPMSLAGGVRTFHLHGQTSGLTAETMVTVDQLNGMFSPSTYFVNPGGTVSFSGGGFAPGEVVQVTVDSSSTPWTTFTVDANGSFMGEGTVTVPFSFAGHSHTFKLTGQYSGVGGQVDILVGGFYPSITPSVWYVTPGQQFTVNGSGYASGEQVQVVSNGKTVTVTADADGSFIGAGPFKAPTSGLSVHMTATGVMSGAMSSQDISLGGLYPSVTPSAWYVHGGTTITFEGSGFIPSEEIILSNGSSTLATVTADDSGMFTGASATPAFGADRTEHYTFAGSQSGAHASVDITIAGLQPYVDADNYYATPGSTIHVHGVGFAPHEAVVISGGTATASTTADATGETPSAAFTLPTSGSGSLVITMTGSQSGAYNNTTITLAPFTTQVSPSTYYTRPGTPVTFEGAGFGGGEVVTIKLNNTIVGTATTTGAGSFTSSPITIPYGSTAAHFEFKGSISGTSNSVDIGLAALNAGIVLSTYYDKGGAPLTITGMGFGSNETVAVTFEGQSIGNATTTAGGDFTLATMVPYGPAGSKTIQARGQTSGAQVTQDFTQPQVYVNAQLGSYAGAPGDAVTFIGSGYMPNEPITITTDRTGTTAVHTFTAGADGTFTNSSYSIPTTFTGGPLTITIKGEHSFVSKSINYYVTGP